MLKMQSPLTIESVIESVKRGESKSQSFCVYAKKDAGELVIRQECFLDAYPEGDDDGEDVFSDFVTDNKLKLVYYGEQFEDVITNVLHQKENASVQDFADALNYYMKHDTFKDF
jgi:hypothetical protein